MAFNAIGNIGASAPATSYTTVLTPLSLTTNTDGTSWVTYASTPCTSLKVTNGTGVALLYRYNATGAGVAIPIGATVTLTGITNANQVGIKRNDTTSGATVVVQAEATTLTNFASIPTTNLKYAYSLFRLTPLYTGSAIRVRRALDNAEKDIGFLADGTLDIPTLVTWAAGLAYVKTWYDQAGNLDLTQSTAANQPQIVTAAGTVPLMDGKPAIFFDGVNDALSHAGTGMPTGSSAFTTNMRMQWATDAVGTRVYLKWGGDSLNTGLMQTRDTNSDLWVRTGNGQYVCRTERNTYTKSVTFVNDGTTFTGYVNSIADNANWQNLPPTYAIVAGTFGVGFNPLGFGSAGANQFWGYTNEVIVYDKALTDTERISLETNQDARNGRQVDYNLLFSGDSITFGVSGTSSYLNSFRYLLMKDLVAAGKSFRFYCSAIIGYSSDDMDVVDKATTGIDQIYLPPANYNILFCGLGQNDVGNKSRDAATSYTFIKQYVANRKATGRYHRIIPMTVEPSSSLIASDTLLQLSALMRAGMKTVAAGGTGDLLAAGATDFLDKQAVPDPNYASNPSGLLPFPWADRAMWQNKTYKPADNIHPGDYGHSLLYNYGIKVQMPWLFQL